MNKIFIYLIILLLPLSCIADDTELYVTNTSSSGGTTNVLFMFNITDWFNGTNFINATKEVAKQFLQETSGINVAIVTIEERYHIALNSYLTTPIIVSHFKPVDTARDELIAHIDNLTPQDTNGIDYELLVTAWEYFAGTTHFESVIDYQDPDSISDGKFVSPIAPGCNENFVMLFTRMHSSISTPTITHINSLLAGHSYPASIDSYHSNKASILKMGWLFGNVDVNSDVAKNQYIKLYTVILPQYNINYEQFFKQAAEYSNGGTFYANEIADLVTIMEGFKEIVMKASIMVSPITSTDAFGFHSQDKKIYFALFQPEAGPFWKGNLKCYKMGADGVIYDKNNNPAIDNTTGFFKTTAHSFWSSSVDGNDVLKGGINEHISADRKIYSDILYSTYNHYSGGGIALSDVGNSLHENNNNITTDMLGIATGANAKKTAIIKWARGIDVDDVNQNSLTTDNRATIGDPLHTKPLLIQYYTGDETIYLTTNDGFLHAVNPANGNTIFSFIPRDLLPDLKTARDNVVGTPKIYGLDAPMTFIKFDANSDGNILDSAGGAVSTNEGAIISLPMRRGGKNIYTLNVSDRQNPSMMWTIRGGGNASEQTTLLYPSNVGIGDYTKLAQTWSIAMPAQIKWQGTTKAVYFFGGGYDPQTDTQTTIATNNIGNAIFMVDIFTGEKLWQASNNSANGTNLIIPEMQYGIASNLTLVDINQDGLTDFIIATDVGGQVFRIDINNDNISANTFATGGLIAKLANDTLSGSRRFFEAATISLAPNNTHLNIAVGSGFREKPLSTYTQDRIHVIKDPHVFTKPTSYKYANGSTITETNLYDATANLIQSGTTSQKLEANNSLNNSHGWYINLEETGEKLFSKLQTYAGVLTFTTYTPPSVTNITSCLLRQGHSNLYALNIENGSAVANLSGSSTLGKSDRKKQLKILVAPEPSIINRGQNGIRVCVGTECFDNIIPSTTSSIKKTYWYQNR